MSGVSSKIASAAVVSVHLVTVGRDNSGGFAVSAVNEVVSVGRGACGVGVVEGLCPEVLPGVVFCPVDGVVITSGKEHHAGDRGHV